jgi:hypothetical protein
MSMISEVDAQKLSELDAIVFNSKTCALSYFPNLLTPSYKVITKNQAEKNDLNVKNTKSWFLNHIESIVDACCNGQVSFQYIKGHQALCSIFILFRNTTENKIVGFITSYVRDPGNDYFIDVICSSGYGKYQLKFFTDFFYLYGGAKSVSLAALPHVLYYYKKFGYQHKHSCDSDPFPQPDFGKATPKNMNSAFVDPPFKQYMSDLQKHQFAAKKYPQVGPDGAMFDLCKSNSMPLTDEQLKICAIDGFYMKHCLTPSYQHEIVQTFLEDNSLLLNAITTPPYRASYSSASPDLAISGRPRFPSSNSGYGSNTPRSRTPSNSTNIAVAAAVAAAAATRKRSANNSNSAFLTVPALNKNNNGTIRRSKRFKTKKYI